MSRALELAAKRQRLQARSADLRREFAEHVSGLSPLISIADAGLAGASWLRRHPGWMVGAGMVMLLVLGPRRMLGIGMRFWGLAQVFLGLRSSLLGLLGRFLPRLLFRSPPMRVDPP